MEQEYDFDNYYLYRHIRIDKNEPFYIGIGTKTSQDLKYNTYQRAYDKSRRTKWWKNITNKTPYEVEILIESNDYNFIESKELEFIALYGRIDKGIGTLVNLTDGGKGQKGFLMKSETKEKLRIANIGKKKSMTSQKQCKKVRNKVTNEVFDSVEKAAKSLGINNSSMIRLLSYRDSHFEYIDGSKKKDKQSFGKCWKRIINKDSKEVFKSLQRAGKSIGITYDQMRRKIKNEGENCKFQYYNG